LMRAGVSVATLMVDVRSRSRRVLAGLVNAQGWSKC
jgi:hypothetical protein